MDIGLAIHNLGTENFLPEVYFLLNFLISRVVQGVRRWIGSQPASRQKKIHGKPISKPQPKEVPAEPVLDKYSTEACAKAALDPSVSEAEEAEYQG
jgi:hypothetical protein